MSLRYTLLASFVGLIVLTLLVFGISAYQIAQRSSTDTETELLVQVNRERGRDLANQYRKYQTLNGLREHIQTDSRDVQMLMLIVDATGRILATSSGSRLADLGTDHLPLQAIAGTDPGAGEIELRLFSKNYLTKSL